MKTKMTLIAAVVALFSGSAFATDCGCIKTPTAYDKTQDAKIGDVKLTAGQAFDIAVEGRATAGNALTTVYGLIPQVNNNAKGIAELRDTKVDKSVFTADQQRQDKALAASVTAQAGIDAKQTVDLKGYADQKATSAYTTAVQHTDVKVARADADRKAGDDALGVRIDTAVSAQAGRDAGQDAIIQQAHEKADAGAVRMDGIEQRAQVTDDRSISNAVRLDGTEAGIRETNAQVAVTDSRSINNAVRLDGVEQVNGQQDKMLDNHETRITQNSSDIVQLYSNGEYAQSRIDTANANIEANRAAQVASNKRIAANTQQLADHEQRLGGLEQRTNRGFADMGKRIDKVQDKANAGVSAAFASSGIPQVTDGQRFAMGAGIGGYEGESALAVGFSTRVTHAVVLKASVASDSQSGFGYNAGVSVGW